jgi:hypothetical protein
MGQAIEQVIASVKLAVGLYPIRRLPAERVGSVMNA